MEDKQIESDALEQENKWGINFETKKKTMVRYNFKRILLQTWYNCKTCFKRNFVFKEAKDTDIINLYYLRCNHTLYRKKNL